MQREFVFAVGAVVVAVNVTAKLMELRKVADEAVARVFADDSELRVALPGGARGTGCRGSVCVGA